MHEHVGVVVDGLSHTTWKPRSTNAFATGKCKWFGVTIETKSTRTSFGSAASRSAIASKLAYTRSGARRYTSPCSRDFAASEENAPATSVARPSTVAARLWTAPMKAPGPPPTIPKRNAFLDDIRRSEYV